MLEVARHAGVSRSTVSYAVTQPDRLSKATLKRVTESMRALDYVGNHAARQLRVGRSRALGLIVPNALNPVYAEHADGADAEASRHGHFVLLVNSRESCEREIEHLMFFEAQQVAGILLAPVASVPTPVFELRRRGTPFVVIGSPAEPANNAFTYLSGDNEEGGFLAATHLLEQGRRRLLFVGGRHHHVNDRLRGAEHAIRAAAPRGVTLDVVRVQQQTADAGNEVGTAILAQSHADRPDGVFAGNDLLALGVLHALIGGSVRVPEDVSIVGYDDIEFAEFAIVPLTSIRHPSTELGAVAVRVLLGMSDDFEKQARESAFNPVLVIRNTSLRR